MLFYGCPTIFHACTEATLHAALSGLDETEDRVLQPYRESRFDAQIRAQISGNVSVLRETAHADGPRRRRSVHQHHPARVHLRDDQLIAVSLEGLKRLCSHARARLSASKRQGMR